MLLVVALRACRDVRFPVAVVVPFGAGVGLAVPMAIAVSLLGENLAVQIGGGIVTWALTLTVAWAFMRRSARNLDRADESAGP